MERKLIGTASGSSGTSSSYVNGRGTSGGIAVPSKHGIILTVTAFETGSSTKGMILAGYGTSQTPSVPSVNETGWESLSGVTFIGKASGTNGFQQFLNMSVTYNNDTSYNYYMNF